MSVKVGDVLWECMWNERVDKHFVISVTAKQFRTQTEDGTTWTKRFDCIGRDLFTSKNDAVVFEIEKLRSKRIYINQQIDMLAELLSSLKDESHV